MTSYSLVAAGLLAAISSQAARADGLQVSKFRHSHPALMAIYVCPGGVAPSECDARSALQSIVDPPWAQESGCGVASQAVLAGSGMQLVEGQYVKIVCGDRSARAD